MQLHARSHIVKRSFCSAWFRWERPRILRGFVPLLSQCLLSKEVLQCVGYSDYRVMYNVSEDVKGRNVTESLASSLEGESTLAERQLV